MKQQHSALTRSTQAISHENRTQDLLADSSAGIKRRIMWIDGVGGFQLVDGEEVLIGQATSSNPADINIVGDLSRQAAAIRRSEGDYLLQPLQEASVNGQKVDRPQLLNDGDTIQLGQRVQVTFRKPTPLSATASLTLKSLNRFKPHVDGVLLLADSCVLGPSASSHVVCPNWKSELLLFRHNDGWFFRTLDEVDVNGKPAQGQILVESGMRMRGEEFSLSIE